MTQVSPNADRSLAGMCDAARKPPTTPRHRPIWAKHTEQTKTFLGSLGPTRRSERARLQADHDRTLRVIADIDIAANTDTSDHRE